jgi:inosine-uridine nucleoside N-ribohydrolase
MALECGRRLAGEARAHTLRPYNEARIDRMNWRGAMMKVHLDTDLGGDIDDLCALALLLCWPEPVEITGITVVGDTGGKRTAAVRYVLAVAGRSDIPVAMGSDTSEGFYRYELGLPPEEVYWPAPLRPAPNPAREAIDLLRQSIKRGATVIGIGPYTNLALLERAQPGILARTDLVLMGGYLLPPRSGYPPMTNEDDFNVQVDVASARTVFERSSPTLVPLTVTVETALRRSQLDRLRASGPLGALIARQAVAFAGDFGNERFGATYPRVADDIINFQHDPLACAIALGWRDGVRIEEHAIAVEERDGWLHEHIAAGGQSVKVVTAIDGPRFDTFWLETVTRGPRPSPE